MLGQKPRYLGSHDGILPVTVIENQGVAHSSAMADMFSTAPEVNFSGQGGLLQTVSLRGLSRWRIQTLVEGVPIHTERRAGNAAEFIAPSLVSHAYVLSGAASTQLGSGALGGGIDLQLAATSDTSLGASYGSAQDYRSVQILGGKEAQNSGLYWGANVRHANNGEDSLNQTLFNGFEQSVGWFRHLSETSVVKDALLIVSKANNVGKASSDLPEQRQTVYPDNDHWLAKLDFEWMNARVYAHSASLHTQIVRPEERTNTLHNKALGWGASISEDFLAGQWQFNWQFALDARNRVEATEQEITALGETVFNRTNLLGRQQAWSFNLDTVKRWQSWEFAGGVRLAHMRQNDGAVSQQNIDDTNLSGFVGGKKRWLNDWSSGFYISHGFRVPTLTERFFSGSTPRGVTLGDPTLRPEKARNIQVDIAYSGDTLQFSASAFQQSIDHYIERVALSPTVLKYTSLAGAKIDGISYQANWALSSYLSLTAQGQWLWAQDNNGESVNDVSPNQHDVKFTWQSATQSVWLNMTYREAHRKPGSSELATSKVTYFRAGYQQELSPSLTASIFISNITDKAFPISTDDLSANAQGRDIAINLAYIF